MAFLTTTREQFEKDRLMTESTTPRTFEALLEAYDAAIFAAEDCASYEIREFVAKRSEARARLVEFFSETHSDRLACSQQVTEHHTARLKAERERDEAMNVLDDIGAPWGTSLLDRLRSLKDQLESEGMASEADAAKLAVFQGANEGLRRQLTEAWGVASWWHKLGEDMVGKHFLSSADLLPLAEAKWRASTDYAGSLRKFIEALPCPDPLCSDGSIVSTGPDPQNDACEWCYMRHMLLNEPQARTEIVRPQGSPDFIKAVRALVFAARTSGGVAGRDETLCAVLDVVEDLLPPMVGIGAGGDEQPVLAVGTTYDGPSGDLLCRIESAAANFEGLAECAHDATLTTTACAMYGRVFREAAKVVLSQDSADAKDAARYRFLRVDDNWGEDAGPEYHGSAWGVLGEKSGREFDEFIDERMGPAQVRAQEPKA